MLSWVDKAVGDVLQKREHQQMEHSLIQKSSNAAPVLFDMLAKQLAGDIDAFNKQTGKSILYSMTTNGIIIKHEPFPTFTLELNRRDSDIVVKINKRQTAMSLREADHIELISLIAGTGPQEYYYLYQGAKLPRVEEVAGYLMYPLIQFLNA
jgi:hypothetical protein